MNKLSFIVEAIDALNADWSMESKLLWKSDVGQKIISTQKTLAKLVATASDSIDNIDDLLALEKHLQYLDYKDARSKTERNSAKKAAEDYMQIEATISQMRKNPQEYVQANKSLETDWKKMPKMRGINQILANLTRLKNRDTFPSPEQKIVWEARIELAKATQKKLYELHDETIEKYNKQIGRDKAADKAMDDLFGVKSSKKSVDKSKKRGMER